MENSNQTYIPYWRSCIAAYVLQQFKIYSSYTGVSSVKVDLEKEASRDYFIGIK